MVRTRNHLIINERCRCASGRTSRRIPHCPYGLSVLSERESVSPRLLAAIKDNLFRHYLHLFYRLVANFWQSSLCVVTSSSAAAADDDTNLQYTVSLVLHNSLKVVCPHICMEVVWMVSPLPKQLPLNYIIILCKIRPFLILNPLEVRTDKGASTGIVSQPNWTLSP